MTTMSLGQRALGAASSGSLGSYPNLAMSMRFKVGILDLSANIGLSSLGQWQSCKNLQMELQYKKFQQGGLPVDRWLPDRIAYSPITLERPVEAKSSNKVQLWLKSHIDYWNGTGQMPGPFEVTIELLDCHLDSVMTWVLEDARPSKWMGPSLSATDAKVAIEALVIDYSGISGGPPNEDSRKSSEQDRTAKLYPADKPAGPIVEFTFPPKELTISHRSPTQTKTKTKSHTNKNKDGTDLETSSSKEIEPTKLSLPKMTIDGPKTFEYCSQLIEWSKEKSPGGSRDSSEFQHVLLKFEWGRFEIEKNSDIRVKLTKAEITYERFTSDGVPTRASVSLELEPLGAEAADPQALAAERAPAWVSYRPVKGQTLAGIARDPVKWRQLAEANQINDPQRLPAGAPLRLPAGAEPPAGSAP